MPDLRTAAAKLLGIELYPDNMPQWAQDLVNQVCRDYELNVPFKFTWRKTNRQETSGRSWNDDDGVSKSGRKYNAKYAIQISQGWDEMHCKLVLLHELAHQIMPARESHSEAFWKCAYSLYRRYGIDMRYAYECEKNYKDMARTIGAEFLAGIW